MDSDHVSLDLVFLLLQNEQRHRAAAFWGLPAPEMDAVVDASD